MDAFSKSSPHHLKLYQSIQLPYLYLSIKLLPALFPSSPLLIRCPFATPPKSQGGKKLSPLASYDIKLSQNGRTSPTDWLATSAADSHCSMIYLHTPQLTCLMCVLMWSTSRLLLTTKNYIERYFSSKKRLARGRFSFPLLIPSKAWYDGSQNNRSGSISYHSNKKGT